MIIFWGDINHALLDGRHVVSHELIAKSKQKTRSHSDFTVCTNQFIYMGDVMNCEGGVEETIQSFTNNFRWNLWRSECSKMVINFFWQSLSLSEFTLLQRVSIVDGIQPENCNFFPVKMG